MSGVLELVRPQLLVGAVNKGKVHMRTAGTLPLPSILKKNYWTAKKFYWLSHARLDSTALLKALDSEKPENNGDSDDNRYERFKKLFKEGADWSMFAIMGKDTRNTGLRNRILVGIVPAGSTFAEGPGAIAIIKKPDEFELWGAFTPHPIRTTEGVGWDDYLVRKQKESPVELTGKQLKEFKKEWREKYRGPAIYWFGFLPGKPTPSELASFDQMRITLGAAAISAKEASGAKVRAESAEAQVGALLDESRKQSDHIHDLQAQISEERHKGELAETELELTKRPPPSPTIPQPVEKVLGNLKFTDAKKKPTDDSWLKAVFTAVLFFIGIALMAYSAGNPALVFGGVVMVLSAVGFWYMDYRHREKKAALAATGKELVKGSGSLLESTKDKVQDKLGQ